MQLLIISGKGGTGKTTVAAALADISGFKYMVDCDVDAPNFSLFYKGKLEKNEDFYGEFKAQVNNELCVKCNKCTNVCTFEAINNGVVNNDLCEGCGACSITCKQKAITLIPEKTAELLITNSSNNYISHSEMEIGSGGSGKIVSAVKKNIEEMNKNNDSVILDGSPGIGCSVIASITGVDTVLVVTEPTQSGLSDMSRVLKLCEFFDVKTYVCINKYDLNLELTEKIKNYCDSNGIDVIGNIPFDECVIKAINKLQPVTKLDESIAAKEINKIWNIIKKEGVN